MRSKWTLLGLVRALGDFISTIRREAPIYLLSFSTFAYTPSSLTLARVSLDARNRTLEGTLPNDRTSLNDFSCSPVRSPAIFDFFSVIRSFFYDPRRPQNVHSVENLFMIDFMISNVEKCQPINFYDFSGETTRILVNIQKCELHPFVRQ